MSGPLDEEAASSQAGDPCGEPMAPFQEQPPVASPASPRGQHQDPHAGRPDPNGVEGCRQLLRPRADPENLSAETSSLPL